MKKFLRFSNSWREQNLSVNALKVHKADPSIFFLFVNFVTLTMVFND